MTTKFLIDWLQNLMSLIENQPEVCPSEENSKDASPDVKSSSQAL